VRNEEECVCSVCLFRCVRNEVECVCSVCLFRCVRNEEECVCSVCLFRCNIFIGFRIIKEIPGLVGSGTPYYSMCEIVQAIHREPHGNLILAQDRASRWVLLLVLLILCVLLPGTGNKISSPWVVRMGGGQKWRRILFRSGLLY
jgi:hypothetical protein